MSLIPRMPAPLEIIVGLGVIGTGAILAYNGIQHDAKNVADAIRGADYATAAKSALPFILYGALILSGMGETVKGIRRLAGNAGNTAYGK